MAIGAPIDTEAVLRALLDMLVHKGTLNFIDVDNLMQVGERAYALAPEKHRSEHENGSSPV